MLKSPSLYRILNIIIPYSSSCAFNRNSYFYYLIALMSILLLASGDFRRVSILFNLMQIEYANFAAATIWLFLGGKAFVRNEKYEKIQPTLYLLTIYPLIVLGFAINLLFSNSIFVTYASGQSPFAPPGSIYISFLSSDVSVRDIVVVIDEKRDVHAGVLAATPGDKLRLGDGYVAVCSSDNACIDATNLCMFVEGKPRNTIDSVIDIDIDEGQNFVISLYKYTGRISVEEDLRDTMFIYAVDGLYRGGDFIKFKYSTAIDACRGLLIQD